MSITDDKTARASQTWVPDEQRPTIEWPDPTPEMLTDPRFNAIWSAIKSWDINVTDAYVGYMGATGNHARAILDSLDT